MGIFERKSSEIKEREAERLAQERAAAERVAVEVASLMDEAAADFPKIGLLNFTFEKVNRYDGFKIIHKGGTSAIAGVSSDGSSWRFEPSQGKQSKLERSLTPRMQKTSFSKDEVVQAILEWAHRVQSSWTK